MKIAMNRLNGQVMFSGLKPDSNIIITLPDKKELKSKTNKDGVSIIDFDEARKKFIRKKCVVTITHKDFETVAIEILIRNTKLLVQPVISQNKKG